MRKRGGEISSPLAYEEVDAIATIVELVREVVEPVIQAPFELVDIEYGKIGSDMILSIFVDKPEGITLNDTATSSSFLFFSSNFNTALLLCIFRVFLGIKQLLQYINVHKR